MSQFKMARMTPDGGVGNPEASEAQTSNFLQCIHDVYVDCNYYHKSGSISMHTMLIVHSFNNFVSMVNRTKYSKASCQPQYQSAFDCMKSSLTNDNSENTCKVAMDDFANCREQ